MDTHQIAQAAQTAGAKLLIQLGDETFELTPMGQQQPLTPAEAAAKEADVILAASATDLKCSEPECGFEAKSLPGLFSHQRKHERNAQGSKAEAPARTRRGYSPDVLAQWHGEIRDRLDAAKKAKRIKGWSQESRDGTYFWMIQMVGGSDVLELPTREAGILALGLTADQKGMKASAHGVGRRTRPLVST